jgi:hypothetical protein
VCPVDIVGALTGSGKVAYDIFATAQGHVPVLGSENHVLDGGDLGGGEPAERACASTAHVLAKAVVVRAAVVRGRERRWCHRGRIVWSGVSES